MSVSQIVLVASKKVFGWFADRCHALFMPGETITGKRLENIDKAVDIAEKLEKIHQETIDWTIEVYREMGVAEPKIREELLPEIENSTDPLSVIIQLGKKGAIQGIAELPSDEITPPELPEPQEEEGKETDNDNDPDPLDAAAD